jgi:hypothetical protein
MVAIVMGAAASLPAEEEGFQSLFDGKSLTGWEGNLKTFRVEEGAIVAGTLKDKIPNNEFLCTTARYGNFELRFKCRLVGKGNNAGVQFRSERIPNHFEVSGYQCDMGAAFGRLVWGALYDESRRRKMLAEGNQEKIKEVFRANDWNDMTVRCEGPRIQIWLNGLQTVDFTEPDEKIAREGIIGLQVHGGEPAEAWYQEIRLKKLP